MSAKMKIVIAYDGSDCARAALDDLRLAGLPEEAEAVVLSVTENWLPPPSSYALVSTTFGEEAASYLNRVHEENHAAAQQVRSYFPHWEVKARVLSGSPARMILETAEDWPADLIIIGSHGRTALGRFFLGSVSNKVVTEAHCSVRVARGRLEEDYSVARRILLGFDGTPGAVAAARVVAARRWPQGSEVRLLTAEPIIPPLAAENMLSPLIEGLREEKARLEKEEAAARRNLEAAGLVVTRDTREGDPKTILCEEAERWDADCIFVGAKSLSRIDRFLLGSVSAAVAARAHCSVEVVRAE